MRSAHALLLAVAVTLLCLSPPPALAARTRPGPIVRDYRNGYSIQVPLKWKRSAPKTSDTVEVAGWYGKRKNDVPPTLSVLRVERPPLKDEGEKGLDEIPRELRRRLGADPVVSVRDWIDRTLEPYGPLGRIEEARKVKLGGGKGKLYTVTFRRGTTTVQMLVAAIPAGETEYGIAFACEQQEFEKYHKAAALKCIQSFRSLKIRSEKDVDYDDAFEEEKEGGREPSEQEEWLDRVKAKISNTKEWGYLSTKNYLVLFDRSVKPRTVKRVAVHVEAIRRDVFERLFPTDEKIEAVSVVRVCRDREQYLAYGGSPRSVGYWSSKDRELVFYAKDLDAIRVLYHEAFHQYIYHALGDFSPHAWFDEGHAEYFAGFNFRGRFLPGKLHDRNSVIQAAVAGGRAISLARFLRLSRSEYYGDASVCYAQGWSLIYFLRHTRIVRYGKILTTYFRALRRELSDAREDGGLDAEQSRQVLEAALDEALAGINLPMLERDWRKSVN